MSVLKNDYEPFINNHALLDDCMSRSPVSMTKETLVIIIVMLERYKWTNHYLVTFGRYNIQQMLITDSIEDCKYHLQRELTTTECFSVYGICREITDSFIYA